MKKDKVIPPSTKVVVRHLPSSLTEEEFLEVVKPLPEHNWFSYHKANNDYGCLGFCRAYINFCNIDDIYTFKDCFDGYVFVDGKGNESEAVVEYAPFQKLALRDASPKRPDPRMGTISTDPDYLQFVQALENPEHTSLPGTEKMLEDLEGSSDENAKTPLVEYIEQRRLEILRKLQNRSQLDKLNTRQLERILKREERKEYVRLRRAEKRRLRIGDRSARKHVKQSTGDDFAEDDDEEYEEMPPPPSRVKGPRAERSSSARSSDASPRVRAKRDKRTPRKLLPEKDKHRRSEAEARVRDKEANEGSPKLDGRKIVVIKRRLDTQAEEDTTKSSKSSCSEQRHESLTSSSKDNNNLNSTTDLVGLERSRASEATSSSSLSKNNDKSDATAKEISADNKEISTKSDAITQEISTDNKSCSGVTTLPVDDGNSSSESRILANNNETSSAKELCLVQGKAPDDSDKSSFQDESVNTKAMVPNSNDNDIKSPQSSDDSEEASSMNDASSKNQKNASKEVAVFNNVSSKASEFLDHDCTENNASETVPLCSSGGSVLSTSPDSALSSSRDAALSSCGEAAFSASADAALSSLAVAALSASADAVLSSSGDAALSASVATGMSADAALDTPSDNALGTFADSGSSGTTDTTISSSTEATISASADVALATSTDATLGFSMDKASALEELPRATESGDDSSKAGADPRAVRKIRNKDRPAMQLYRPGQCRLSSARVKQDNATASTKDTSSSHSSTPSPVLSGFINDPPNLSSTSKRNDDSQQKSSSSKGENDSYRSVGGSTEGGPRGKDRHSRDDTSSAGSSGVGRGERGGSSKKRPAKTLEFTNQRHHRGGGGGRGSDRGRGRYGQSKHGGSFEGGAKHADDGDTSAASSVGEVGHAKGSDGAGHTKGNDGAGHTRGSDSTIPKGSDGAVTTTGTATAPSAATAPASGVTKSQGKRYSRMRPVEK